MKITINPDLSSRVVTPDGLRFTALPSYNPETLVPFSTKEEVQRFIETRLTDAYFMDVETPESTATDLQDQVVQATQQRLDNFAKTRNYDSILSATTYATSKIERFAKEGQRAVDLRDETWAKLYEILDEVQSGARPIPGGFSDIEGELPELTWDA